MNAILQEAIVIAQQQPEYRQSELGEILMSAAIPTIQFTEEQIASVEEAIADAEAGRFADPKDIAKLLGRD